ncbi:MAG TPA: nickel pincer cofactor biosynthesis protein LarB [Candidatus Polarisedimenticolia bacterium]|nr:nickel pincer cofactor biosynthesis protein LarB [Candidatus Polarisedimenticolia bacterium]
MQPNDIRRLLDSVRSRKLGVRDALEKLKTLPTEDLGFARYDTHRALRRGFPEVIFGRGKTIEQVLGILERIRSSRQPILVTHASKDLYARAVTVIPRAVYHAEARAITVEAGGRQRAPRKGLVVVTAGTSDIPVAEEAIVTARIMGNDAVRVYDVGVAGIHRLLVQSPTLRDAKVIIAVAGMEGALPSVVGGLVAVPVIAVPTSTGYGASFSGLAALLAMLNSCSSGVTVVNIDNGFGAGYAASQILALLAHRSSSRD